MVRTLHPGFAPCRTRRRWAPNNSVLSGLEAGGVVSTIPLLERITAALDADLIVEICPHAG